MEENKFYCVIKDDLSTKRDRNISTILGQEPTIYYLGGNGYVTDIRFARFWKTDILCSRDESIMSITLKEFMELDLNSEHDDFVFLRNKKLQEKESDLKIKRDEIRGRYMAINAYKPVPKSEYYYWKNCKDCGLKPIIWRFNNGCSTACGCGESIYKHHSISSESIMSYLKRNNGSSVGYKHDELMNNWNNWVDFGVVNEMSGECW